MLKIAVVGGKGGITKTTLSRAIAVRCAQTKREVIGLDMDEDQRSFYRWAQRRKDVSNAVIFPVVPDVSTHVLAKYLRDDSSYDVAVIDGAAYGSKDLIAVAREVDLVVIPTRFSVDDLESCVRVRNALKKAGIPEHKILAVISGVAESKREINGAREDLRTLKMFCLDDYIPHMTIYSSAQDKGLAITEIKSPRLFTLARRVVDGIIATASRNKEVST